MAEARLDAELVARGLCSGRERARAEIEAGHVTVNGRPASKPSQKVAESDVIELSEAFDYVSRGAKKLLGALEAFHISPEGLVCLDCGASTGGFTEVLLRHGARKVYAVDVGHGQLAEKLKRDPCVVNMEGTNVRSLALSSFDPAPELITADLSFISLALVLPVLRGLLGESGRVVCLVKPQFEAGRGKVGKKGVVRDPAVHEEVLRGFVSNAEASGFAVLGLEVSPLRGPEGNIEFLAYLGASGSSAALDITGLVSRARRSE
ncbi:MAG: TlyA family RNA methyltransferase [Oscillospiraceae bacterium]|nr:TlyA family RNA methyltransferase [Oscillospiraceae bacterium]